MIRDGRLLVEQLRQTRERRAAARVLAQARVPLRVPTAFRPYAEVAADGYRYAPILSTSEANPPLWRWRKDKVYAGLAKYPASATDEVRRGVGMLVEMLDQGRGPDPSGDAHRRIGGHQQSSQCTGVPRSLTGH